MASGRSQMQLLEAQMVRLIVSGNDWLEAYCFLLSWRAEDSEVVRTALLQAAIIAYGRPFSGNQDHAWATASPQLSLNKILSPGEQRLHDQLMRLRNKMIAHSDYERNKGRRLGLMDDGVFNGTAFRHEEFDVLEQGIDREAFIALCKKLQVACCRKVGEIDAAFETLKTQTGSAVGGVSQEVRKRWKEPK